MRNIKALISYVTMTRLRYCKLSKLFCFRLVFFSRNHCQLLTFDSNKMSESDNDFRIYINKKSRLLGIENVDLDKEFKGVG